MKATFKMLTTFIIILSIYIPCASSEINTEINTKPAREAVKVEYFVDGKLHVINGTKTSKGYHFNEQSKKILNLATLNWAPYIGENLCNKGWVFQFTVALLVSKGYQVNIHFYPWARAAMLVEIGQMDILFPEYYIEDSAPSDVVKGKKRTELLALSNKFPGGAVSFLKRKNETQKFTGNLNQLKGEMIGIIRGYQNTPEFDAMMDDKLFDVIVAGNELQLMKLLVSKRVGLIIGDPSVFKYSVYNSNLSDSDKQALLNAVEEVHPTLQYNYLHYAVSVKSKNWRELMNDINIALLEFEQSGATANIINKGSRCTADF